MVIEKTIDDLRQLLGDEVVKTSEEAILGHSYDAWPVATKWKVAGNQPLKPDAVVFASRVDQIVTLLRWANEYGVPVTPWGAGSSVTGAPLPLNGGITLDLSRMESILDFNQTNMTVRVEPGIMGHVLEAAMNKRG
ncbi:MAG: FAD-binding oxidoreductase, partial [Anaerolineae bacterium]|nr:FAD-binding oxidoreductase [Anaerolineae bacterium]